jgi:hypothetical protein
MKQGALEKAMVPEVERSGRGRRDFSLFVKILPCPPLRLFEASGDHGFPKEGMKREVSNDFF